MDVGLSLASRQSLELPLELRLPTCSTTGTSRELLHLQRAFAPPGSVGAEGRRDFHSVGMGQQARVFREEAAAEGPILLLNSFLFVTMAPLEPWVMS